MLEINLSSLKLVYRGILLGFVPVFLVCMYFASKLFHVGAGERQSFIWVWSIGGLLLYGYMLLKYYVQIKALERYITFLKEKQFNEALTYGRAYYSIKRKGMLAADGSGLTIYDETAINNDIAAYSNRL